MNFFISARAKKTADTKYAEITPYWIAGSALEDHNSRTKKL